MAGGYKLWNSPIFTNFSQFLFHFCIYCPENGSRAIGVLIFQCTDITILVENESRTKSRTLFYTPYLNLFSRLIYISPSIGFFFYYLIETGSRAISRTLFSLKFLYYLLWLKMSDVREVVLFSIFYKPFLPFI